MIHITWLDPEIVDASGHSIIGAEYFIGRHNVTQTEVVLMPVESKPGEYTAQLLLTVSV